MRLWVDDERPAPEGWYQCFSAQTAISALDSGERIETVSLDHDLGDQDHDPEWTGYTVLKYIEHRVFHERDYLPPEVRIHTANPAARPRMEAAVASIVRYMREREER
jgi:hypothetical protein